MTVMGAIVRIDERGRLVVPSEFRKKMNTEYFEMRQEEGRLVLTPLPDPLKALAGRISRATPLRGLDEAAEEEAKRMVRGEKRHADSGS